MGRTWRIGEVAERTGLTRRTLRHYDELGLLVPSARSWGDYRLYDEADLLRLLQIQNLKALGLSLAEIADALADPDLDAGSTLRSHLDHLEQRIAAEQSLATRLRRLAAASAPSWDEVLDAIAATRQLAHPDPTVRIRAAFDATGSVPELLAALTAEPDPAVQEVLIWSLARQPDSAPAAVARLSDPNPDIRCLMVRLLAKLHDPTSVSALLPLLADSEPRVVTATVRALGSIAAPASASALVGLLGSPAVPEADLVDAIAAAGSAAVEPLAIAAASPLADVRSATADALGRLAVGSSTEHGGRIHSVLAGLLADPESDVRLGALLALGELGPSARPELERALADPALHAVAQRLLDLHVT
ncbi:MAG: HEAT repeat domain-containing protein [Propionicimonas sp.]|uniref:MerR family transcriptional regulator n=1 Tax=Propionicimonas sp. TaxID=1955623 RepID=UPI003D0B968A